jgi:hypothetical protein
VSYREVDRWDTLDIHEMDIGPLITRPEPEFQFDLFAVMQLTPRLKTQTQGPRSYRHSVFLRSKSFIINPSYQF